MQEAFAKTKKATNILRPAIDVSFLRRYEEFLRLPSIEKKKKLFRKFFLRFFFDFFRKIRIFRKNDTPLGVKTPHFKSAPTLFLLKIFKKSKKSQKWSPDLGVSIGPIIGVIGGNSGELEHPTFFFSLVKPGFSECRGLYLAKYAF